MKKQEIIISGVHLDLTEALKNMVKEKVQKLFKHEEDIIRLRVELEADHKKGQSEFIAAGHIEINGPQMIVKESSEDLYKAIDLMADKLDRKLRRRARMLKVKRRMIHALDVPATIPKVLS